ncbi:bifunctional glycosyltransferase family 2/GtrA family protein [Herbiconiux sp.]|uniref:bifunctional glycosyltransferase family 2/GtrA family protein n=1 Tax=Herbiconiux sp. TaxID=1871186 RepID=UPI0025C46A94|nr:bifunctional glycosyltransferase family 2/GtrA family protein [Herbiconiux sp.]
MIVLIPAYEPDARLVDVVRELRAAAPEASVLVVDDGSGSEYAVVFDVVRAAGAEVIGYAVNRGKGHALKTGFAQVLERHPGEVVVCADSDGQHRTADILRVAAELAGTVPEGVPGSVMVIGGRRFTGRVPLRSRLGNTVARGSFRMASGLEVGDTQTGLRGYPPGMLPWLLEVKGERFEYELNALLGAGAAGYGIRELPIETVYLDHNASSHFRPVRDSLLVMRPFLRYAASSLAAFLIDAILLVVLFSATGSLLLSVVGARLASAAVNFVVNRQLVFRARRRRPVARDALRYAALAVVLLSASYGLLDLATGIGMPLLAAKLSTDTLLSVAGFLLQRRLVFARAQPSTPHAAPAPNPPAATAVIETSHMAATGRS